MTLSDARRRELNRAFQMPKVQTMVSRKSSITNAFVNAIIPAFLPTPEEIDEALRLLGMEVEDIRCAYCGDRSTEWDHLRPLVLDRRPTGYVTEIANLVPACGKCNQSKGNKPWRDWMRSSARWSPTGRGLEGVEARIETIERYEAWKSPTRVDFVAILGEERWSHYWGLCDAVNDELRAAQDEAELLKAHIAKGVKQQQ